MFPFLGVSVFRTLLFLASVAQTLSMLTDFDDLCKGTDPRTGSPKGSRHAYRLGFFGEAPSEIDSMKKHVFTHSWGPPGSPKGPPKGPQSPPRRPMGGPKPLVFLLVFDRFSTRCPFVLKFVHVKRRRVLRSEEDGARRSGKRRRHRRPRFEQNVLLETLRFHNGIYRFPEASEAS